LHIRNKLNLNNPSKIHSQYKPRAQRVYTVTAAKTCCPHCQENHPIYSCKGFLDLSPYERYLAVKKTALCLNCLRLNHRLSNCTKPPCQKCQKKHNSLLHFEKQTSQETNELKPASSRDQVINLHSHTSSEALLATAMVDIVNHKGQCKSFRLFLDTGSQAHFITEEAASMLDLVRQPVDISVSGLSHNHIDIKYSTSAVLKSKFNKYSKQVEFLIVPSITKVMPSSFIDIIPLDIPRNIVLADPEFNIPRPIDILIGVKLFYKLLCVGQIRLENQPNAILQKTQLGWIIAGEIDGNVCRKNSLQCHIATHSNLLEENIKKFWEIEEVPFCNKVYSQEEVACENHFREHTRRDNNGRYIVRLPFNENKHRLGKSRISALHRFLQLENRFSRDTDLKTEYSKFLHEYEFLGHMSLSTAEESDETGFYLPHHAVKKCDSLTTKMRVVFDGSAKTTSGFSLNEALMVGPTIQGDLFSLLVRFRMHQYVLTADIEKMYRQIMVHLDDIKYQQILYRAIPTTNINTYQLKTVTYGTACAPYLATRVLKQLADDEENKYPIVSTILKRDFYVDDLLTGATTRDELAKLRDDLITVLQKGGFQLRKWASNDPSLIPIETSNTPIEHLSLHLESTIKTLGTQWNPSEDNLSFSINLLDNTFKVTKRSILSQIAKLFDPLGLIGPIISKAKIIIQILWKAGITWDSSVPLYVHTMWCEFKSQLHLLSAVNFPRCIVLPNSIDIQVHGFCDASEKAYGACIYLRSQDVEGNVQVTLVCSRSRVAPVKPLTLPRLELSAAVLLAKLLKSTKQALALSSSKTYCWSDSTITLNWIKTEPHLLKTFVSNRVALIQELTSSVEWRHVSSLENPADLVSRGQMPDEFLNSTWWQNGPNWLYRPQSYWPEHVLCNREVLELRPMNVFVISINIKIYQMDLIEKYSSFEKLKHIVAYISRFINNIKNPDHKRTGHLQEEELNESTTLIVRLVQSATFSKEINCLKLGRNINKQSRLLQLNPFVDQDGILRVGGRLLNAEIPISQRHPILLPSNHHITRTLIREEHLRLKHAGIQTTLYSIREIYWPLNGRNITRHVIHQCVKCFRAKPRFVTPIMGNLPQHRVTFARPFLNVGIDFCGPLYIKEKRFRNRNRIKVYIAVYVCLTTRAVHLEVVSDLTTDAFLASLKRFFARRGRAQIIYSDNAANFVGASRELQDLFDSKNFKGKLHQFSFSYWWSTH